jgi:hypothetical protein
MAWRLPAAYSTTVAKRAWTAGYTPVCATSRPERMAAANAS